jgi:S1-C subfamily serine protease
VRQQNLRLDFVGQRRSRLVKHATIRKVLKYRVMTGLLNKQITLAAVVLAAGLGVGWVGKTYFSSALPSAGRFIAPTELPIAREPDRVPLQTRSANSGESRNFIAAAVERVGPAVVRINTSRQVTRTLPDEFDNPFFRNFFGDEGAPPPSQRQQGSGSGFIVSADGQIITNAHVVEGASQVSVTLRDGREFEGTVVGADPVTDVAAIQINAEEVLPTVSLGDSDQLQPGQWAIAIGNPLGLDNTVTAGIISAIERPSNQVGVRDGRVRFIQTDAAINPGNSGGPLLNDQGEVIGINTAIRANAQGLGFAIPIRTAQRIATELFATGKFDHPYLGIQMVDLTPEIQQEINNEEELLPFQIQAEQGVLILEVLEQTPAARAGLQPGDVILNVGGVPVLTSLEVQEQVEASTVGDRLLLEIDRNGDLQTVEVRPTTFPSNARN